MKMRLAYFLIIPLSLVTCESNKRILLSDSTYVQQLEQTVQSLKAAMADVTAKVLDLTTTVTAPKNELSLEKAKNAALEDIQDVDSIQNGSGGIYVRWGRSPCPANESELVYSGYAGFSWWQDTGAATNTLCMVPDPENYSTGFVIPFAEGPRIFGVEYYISGESNVAEYDDAPCSVCRSYRSSVIMMPGRKTCYVGWTTEYTGYIVAGNRNAKGGSEFLCLDDQPEPVPHGTRRDAGGCFDAATSHCGSLTCPPYKENQIVVCVVCSK